MRGFDEPDHGYDDETPVGNPFAPSRYERMLGPLIWFLSAVRFWITRPFRWLRRSVGHVVGYSSWRFDQTLQRFYRFRVRMSVALIEFLHVEGVRVGVQQQVQELQQKASRSVDELTYAVADRALRASWSRRLVDRIRQRLVRLHLAWLGFLEWTEQSPVTRALTAPLRIATRGAHSLKYFMLEWFWTRDFRHLLFGIPAILLMMPLAYCAVRLPFYSPEDKSRHYRQAANLALQDEDFQAADLYFRKLAQLGDVHEQVIWQAALLADEQGDVQSAYDQMRSIAPLDHPGLIPAHRWIAHAIASRQVEVGNPAADELLEAHLRHILARQPDDFESRLWLAELCRQRGEDSDALRLLRPIQVESLRWAGRVRLADLYIRLGQTVKGRRIAQEAIEHFQHEQAQTEPSHPADAVDSSRTAEDFAYWAAAYELTGDTASAIKTLINGLTAFPQDRRLSQATLDISLPYYDRLPRQTADDLRRRLKILQLLLGAVDDGTPVLDRIARLVNEPTVAVAALEQLEAQERRGPLPAEIQRLLGDLAIVRNDRVEARRRYELAIAQDPNAHVALNNLAVLLSDSSPAELDAALVRVEQALALEPENVHYLETRGQIFLARGQWDAATQDLSRALNGMPDKREIHESLAVAYRELGEVEQAELHAAQARR